MFFDKDELYFFDVRRNNIIFNDIIDDIFGVEVFEGWFCFRKSKCVDKIFFRILVMV